MIVNLSQKTDPNLIIQTVGLAGLLFIIFAESGLFFGFFFPGDSLLFTAGLLASQGYLNIYILLPGVLICAVLGDNAGYFFGKKIGPKIFTKEDSLFFNKKYAYRAKEFYEKHGNKTIILARFIPVVRTFAPIVAGVGSMKYSNFLKYNIMGALLWSVGVVSAGFILGATIPNIDKYLLPIILGIMATSFIPVFYQIFKPKKQK